MKPFGLAEGFFVLVRFPPEAGMTGAGLLYRSFPLQAGICF